MKKLFIGFFIIISFVFNQNVIADETIRIANGEWMPYHSKKLPHYGAGSRIVTEAFALEGVKVKWSFMPWKRGYVLAKKGKKLDGSIGWIKTPEREKEVYISNPVYGGRWVFFHLKSYSFDWNTIEDLKGIKIGATANYVYGKAFDEAEKSGSIKVYRAPTEKMSFKMLLKGRFKIFPFAMDGGYGTLKKEFSSNERSLVTHHPRPLQDKAYRLVVAKNDRNKRLLKLFNKGLKRLKESGKVDKYIEEAKKLK